MYHKFKKDILKAILRKEYACDVKELKKVLVANFGYKEEVSGQLNIFSSKVHSYLKTLEDSGYVISDTGQTPWGAISKFYSLTEKGYSVFDPWYKKLWNFINDDFAKLLSLISIVLSIIATIVSFVK